MRRYFRWPWACVTLLLGLAGHPAHATSQANTIHDSGPGGNGVVNLTAPNTDNTNGAWTLGGHVFYDAAAGPGAQGTNYSFSQDDPSYYATLTRLDDTYVDADVAVDCVFYMYNVSTYVETQLDHQYTARGTISIYPEERGAYGPTDPIYVANIARARYRVRGGHWPAVGAFIVSGSAWTGDL